MIVVADTSPINYLIAITQIEVLPKLYSAVLIPPTVKNELQSLAAPGAVHQWIASPPEWLHVRQPTRAPDAELMRIRIDPGEREAILLAEEVGADEIILDDLRGRREAERRKLHAVGTLGVLQAASRKKFLDLRKALELLRSTSFYITEELMDRLMAEAKE